MSRQMEIFDCARLRLRRGVNLVEASAGTGKTYAIAMLVLRLLTEEGIPIDRILVVTFTKAATAELKERIRRRLVMARDLLLGVGSDPDQALIDWENLARDRRVYLERLQLALGDIDRAAIFTIHGFCQRMLQEQALESRQLFQVELVPDPVRIREQVVRDFWRQTMYEGNDLLSAVLFRHFNTPEALLSTVAKIGGDISALEPQCPGVAELAAHLTAAYDDLRLWWQNAHERLRQSFTEAIAGGYFKIKLTDVFDLWWRQLADFFAGQRRNVPDGIEWLTVSGLLDCLNGRKLSTEAKKLAFLADWPLAGQLAERWLALERELRLAFRITLAEQLRTEVDRRLRKRGSMSYNDLILRLAAALDGDDGAGLRRILADRFGAALIDEFQDTDAGQWRIFSSVFGGGGHFLYLIGDPKQAIYRFRGADIHSYFAARERADHHLTLDRNFRSHPLLVEAVNKLFSADNPFLFPGDTMPYHPVAAGLTEEDGHLVSSGKILEPMLYCHLPAPSPEGEKKKRWNSTDAAAAIREFAVREISRLLTAGVSLVGKENRPMRPRDIAILARRNDQAEEYQRALAAAGIPAVVASRKSVFKSGECEDLLRLLQAVDEPGNLRFIKAAMTTSWFGLSGQDLQTIWRDEEVFDGWRLRFQTYNRRWRDEGFLPMMSALLGEERVFAHLARQELAERRISNIYHLLELIQEAAADENLGPVQTLQWLQTMRAGGGSAEDFELRLESDEEAVQVVTMHGAKGLQYPVVFCPFLWYRTNWLKNEKELVTFHDREKRLRADLGSADFEERRRQAERDELSEDLRLLYVAVTRAKLRCYVIWADVKGHAPVEDSFNSALGHLLFAAKPADEEGQIERLRHLAMGEGVAACEIDLDTPPAVGFANAQGKIKLSCRQPSRRSLQTVWQMSSYSALASQSIHEEEGIGEGRDAAFFDLAGDDQPIAVTGLPAGARFGNLVHDLLEEIPFKELAADGVDLTGYLEGLARRYGLQIDAMKITGLLKNAVTTGLHGAPTDKEVFTLADLDAGRLVREMPFYFHLGHTTTAMVNELLAADPAVVPLSYREMQGYLTGFVDLICEYGGRLYIVDYKTNNLGDRQADYAPTALLEAMRNHNYGLQYWIYSLVLHRYLDNCLEGYEYDRHFGGVMYLFVRGMNPAMPGSGAFHARPEIERLAELDRCLGGAK
jgi:exodeoxyribonuclease V beta subunit